MLSIVLNNILDWMLAFCLKIGYPGTLAWMTIESSFIVWPSEPLLLLQGALVSEGKLLFLGLLLASIIGSLIGALINYAIGYYLGRAAVNKLVSKYGKFLFVDSSTIIKSEAYFAKNGEITTFVGRLIPVIRQFISIPAGFAKMNLGKFLFYTGLGAGIWSAVLISLGMILGNNLALIKTYINEITVAVLVVCFIGIVLYRFIKKKKVYPRMAGFKC